MRVRLDTVVINHFKRIESLEIDLQPVTALVGGNTSGKSSALQAAQLGVSILQAALRSIRPNGAPDFRSTVANDAVLFRPTERLSVQFCRQRVAARLEIEYRLKGSCDEVCSDGCWLHALSCGQRCQCWV